MLKAVVFDFDGVIAYTEELHMNAVQEIVEPLGIRVSKQVWKADFAGRGTTHILQELFRRHGISEDVEEYKIKKKEVFNRMVETEGVRMVDGIDGVLWRLAEKHVPMAVASGSSEDTIALVLSKLNLQHYFKWIVGANSTTNKKPHPEPFLKAA